MSFYGKIFAFVLAAALVAGTAWYIVKDRPAPEANPAPQIQDLDYDTLIAYYFSQRPDLADKPLGYDYALFEDCRAVKDAEDGNTVQRRGEFQAAFEKWVKALPADMALPERAIVHMTGTFGPYNEATQMLYFDPLDVDSIVRIQKQRGRIVYTCHPSNAAIWPEEFHVRFTNGDAFNGIPLPPAIAKRLETDKGQKVEITMTVSLGDMDTRKTTVLKATPTVTATILDMQIVHVDRLGKKIRDLYTFDAAAVAALNAAWDEKVNGSRMPANSETFARWADALQPDLKLVEKFGYAQATDPLRSIGFAVTRADLDYPRTTGAVPRDLLPTGAINVRPVWMRIGTTPKEMEFKTDIGTVALQFSNQWDYDGKFHTISPELLALLLRADLGVEWSATMVFTPLIYFEDTKNGKPRHVFRGRIERMDYTAKTPIKNETAATVFTEQTLVRKKHIP